MYSPITDVTKSECHNNFEQFGSDTSIYQHQPLITWTTTTSILPV